MSVDHSARSGGIIGIYFFIFYNIKVCCLISGLFSDYLSLMLGKPRIRQNNLKTSLVLLILQLWDFSKGPKNEFETALVNEPSMFEPLEVY